MRKEKLGIVRLKTLYPENLDVEKLFRETFGYPADLPDLTAKRPKSNSRPDGVHECHFLRRFEGRLPEAY